MRPHAGLGVNMFNLVVLYFLIGIGVGIWYIIDQKYNEPTGELILSMIISILFGGIVVVELLVRSVHRKFVRPLSAMETKKRKK
jgi:hypothetical protein